VNSGERARRNRPGESAGSHLKRSAIVLASRACLSYTGVVQDSDLDAGPSSDHPRWFATTHWSVVMTAKQGVPSEAAVALEKLCRTYWPPLYAYIRRDGQNATEAQDLTQEFFARLSARDYLQHLHHQNGKFRSFLLAYLKTFLSEQRRKAGAQKRGGGQEFVLLDTPVGEEGYLLEPVDELTPDEVFERRWAPSRVTKPGPRLIQTH
jgi:DNA-directed RNA polymerase specialized sigma24 family protein